MFSPCPKCINCLTNISFGRPNGLWRGRFYRWTLILRSSPCCPGSHSDNCQSPDLLWPGSAMLGIPATTLPAFGGLCAGYLSYLCLGNWKQAQSQRVCYGTALCLLNCTQLFATPWTVAQQAPLSMGILQARILEWVAISCTTSLKNNAATMLCASLDGRGVWERMDTWVCMAESLHLKISQHCYLAIPQYKKIKFKKMQLDQHSFSKASSLVLSYNLISMLPFPLWLSR